MNKQTKDLNMKRKTNNVHRERARVQGSSLLTVQCYQWLQRVRLSKKKEREAYH